MVYLLDTSAINNLLDHPESDTITTGLASTNTIYITALNVGEALATPDSSRRRALIEFEKRLSKGEAPILFPLELLSLQCQLHADGKVRQRLPLSTQDPFILHAYKSTATSDEDGRDWILRWKDETERNYQDMFKNSRPAFQTLFAKGSTERPRSFFRLLRDHYGKDEDFLYEYVSSFYKGACGKTLERDGFRQVLSDLPELLLTLLSYAYSVYVRNIKENGHSQKKNPGAVDLWSVAYLPHCDRFITHDNRQHKAFRRINVFNPNPTKVLSYITFVNRLLMG